MYVHVRWLHRVGAGFPGRLVRLKVACCCWVWLLLQQERALVWVGSAIGGAHGAACPASLPPPREQCVRHHSYNIHSILYLQLCK